mmetsp:Transcript_15530/g.39345  ORF Transcript_15530/g.39345 Transcript_15530/m.39345 type:complete len:250 (+) Transcript_15530:38-787(+)
MSQICLEIEGEKWEVKVASQKDLVCITIEGRKGTWSVERSYRSLQNLKQKLKEKGCYVASPPKPSTPDWAARVAEWIRLCEERCRSLVPCPLSPFLSLRIDLKVVQLREKGQWMQEGFISFSHPSVPSSLKSPVRLPTCFFKSLSEVESHCSLLLIHGYADCGRRSRFEEVAHYLCEKGINVFAMDLPGHGQASGTMGYVHSKESLVAAAEAGLEELRLVTPNLPLFVFGHSMGKQWVDRIWSECHRRE